MKSSLFDENGVVYYVLNLSALLDTFTLEEIEVLYKTNLYYLELNKDLMELVDLGYIIDVNNIGFNSEPHNSSLNIIKEYVTNNFNESIISQWLNSIHFDWRDKKPKKLNKKK